MPKSYEYLFTRKISKDAISKGERSEDHLYPRKIAALEILKFNWINAESPVETLSNPYIQKYGRFNYVSKIENKKLTKLQKNRSFCRSKDCI